MQKERQYKLIHVATVPLSLYCFLDGQVRYMKEAGYEVHGVASPGPLLDRFGERERCQCHAIDMPRAVSPLQDLRSVVRLYSLFRTLRPDIVHSHTPKGGLLGTIAAYLARVPVRIYHVHGLPHMTANGVKRAILRCTERISCRLAGQVYCVSKSLAELVVEEKFCSPDKVRVLYNGSINGIDAQLRFNPARHDGDKLREALGIPRDARTVGFVGRLVLDKGILDLHGAWQVLRAKYPDLHLLLVGPFEEKNGVSEATREEMAADDRVHLVGHVDDPAPYYAAMDVLAFPSHREGFGLVNIEAAAMAVPVVSTRITGCVDSVVDGATGLLVPSRDADALTEAIAMFLDDPALRRTFGEAGRRWVSENFRQAEMWRTLEAQYCQLYERLSG